jgi:hypothetical protein
MAVGRERVLRDIDQHRAGAAAGGDVKRFMNRARQFGQRLDQEIVLGAGARESIRDRAVEQADWRFELT